MLDGDNVRHGLNRDLGFTEADRVENIRRVGEVAKLMVESGLIVLCSFISPYRAERDMVRRLVADGEFIEVFVDTPIEDCMQRDPKGLYAKAKAGKLKNFTGVDAPYEVPDNPEIRLQTNVQSASELAAVVLHALQRPQNHPTVTIAAFPRKPPAAALLPIRKEPAIRNFSGVVLPAQKRGPPEISPRWQSRSQRLI